MSYAHRSRKKAIRRKEYDFTQQTERYDRQDRLTPAVIELRGKSDDQ